uniref:Uncharacterized protein n=1 Tax=Timema bartmani TaxID=61472 RepID=A0A7R9F2Y9_9NEOP|nr:unnamed protein product [Timema bartmani]
MEKRYKKMERRQNKIKKALCKEVEAEMAGKVCLLFGRHGGNGREQSQETSLQRQDKAKVGFVNASEETPDYAIPSILKLRKNLFLTFASWTYLMIEEMKKYKEKGKLRSIVELFDETYDINKEKKHRIRGRRKKDGSIGDSSEDSDNREVLNKMYEDWNNPYEVPARVRDGILATFEKKPYWYLDQNLDHKKCNFMVYRWINEFDVVIERETDPEDEFYREYHEHATGSFCSAHSDGGIFPESYESLVLEEVP